MRKVKLNRHCSVWKPGFRLCILAILAAVWVSSCGSGSDTTGGGDTASGSRETVTEVSMPEASGSTVYQNDAGTIVLDASHTEDGYVMIKYTGEADKVQVQITDPDNVRTPFPLKIGEYEAVDFTDGDGQYQVSVLEHTSGDDYGVGLSKTLDIKLSDEFEPFLYPNQYCDYKADATCVKKGMELSEKSSDDLNFIQNVYNYVTKNIKYDEAMAENIPDNYVPDPDATMKSGKGICLDYASLTAAMLRSQKVPTKVEVGYSGNAYHAWISVWTKETGWVDKIIRFDGSTWTLMDPTLGANNDNASVKKYISDGSNYTLQFTY